jgi:hypothetical protein
MGVDMTPKPTWQHNNTMHAKPDLRVLFFCLQDFRSGSVIVAVIMPGLAHA